MKMLLDNFIDKFLRNIHKKKNICPYLSYTPLTVLGNMMLYNREYVRRGRLRTISYDNIIKDFDSVYNIKRYDDGTFEVYIKDIVYLLNATPWLLEQI